MTSKKITLSSLVKQIIGEVREKNFLNEIDWDDTFSDVKKTCLNPEELVKYLNDVIANRGKSTKDREKFPAKYPYIHAKSKLFKNYKEDSEEIDVDDFIGRITEKPNNIINLNDKIEKSGDKNEFVYKTGIPALRGLVYDKKQSKFFTINTCPGAGSCVTICYARKGNFVRYPASYDLMTKRLNYLLNHPDLYEKQMYNELKGLCEKHSAFEGYKPKVFLRWNDSGDFFAKKYVEIAENVMTKLKEDGYNIDSYAYTKVADVSKTQKFGNTTFSTGSAKGQISKIDRNIEKISEVIPKQLAQGLNLMKKSDEEEYKRRVAEFFNIGLDNLITYDELMSIPKSNVKKYNVIVTSNDGDDAAFRKDVKNIYLAYH